MKNKNLSIILPTLNEIGNIIKLIRKIRSICHSKKIKEEIIVVDDNSPDGTGFKVKRKFKTHENVKVFIRTREKGLASAIYFGIKKAQGKFLLVMDTDFNHDPNEISVMLRLIKSQDLVIGSRFIKNGGMEDKLRHWLSYAFNQYLRILLKHTTYDNLSGFFLIRRSKLVCLPLKSIFYGFGDYFIRLIYFSHKKRLTLIETPVFYKNRNYGVSKSRFLNMFVTYTYSALRLRLNEQ